MNIQETIREFLLGNTEITAFRAMYDADPAIENYLQSIIDEMRRTGKPVKKYPIHIVGRDMESSMAGRLPALQAGAGEAWRAVHDRPYGVYGQCTAGRGTRPLRRKTFRSCHCETSLQTGRGNPFPRPHFPCFQMAI